MLRSISDLEDFTISATDGTIGHVRDFYFDDEAWVLRYLVVETGPWLLQRQVLISPLALGDPVWSEKTLPVTITKEQVRGAPALEQHKPVSRQHEMLNLGYYGYTYYWEREQAERLADDESDGDPHLRSCNAVRDYHIAASDGDMGHVHGFLIDDDSWIIRYMIVSTSNWWGGHQVLIAPEWVQDVSWAEGTVTIDLSRQEVRNSPPYTHGAAIGRKEEMGIYRHYGRSGYWLEDVARSPR